MRTIFRWTPSRLIFGASAGVLALALSAPNAWAQSDDDSSKETTTTTQSDSDHDTSASDQSDNSSEKQSDRNSQSSNNNNSSTYSQDRKQSDSSDHTGDDSTSSTNRSQRDGSSDDQTGPAFETSRGSTQSERNDYQDSRQQARQSIRESRDRARDATRDARSEARDTARSARQGARETGREARDYARDARRDYRDEWQDERRNMTARDRESRQNQGWRGDLRDEVRDFARDTARQATDYGRRAARDAFDSDRDSFESNDQDRYSRDSSRQWRDRDNETDRESRDYARSDRDDRNYSRGRDAYRGSNDQYARDSYRNQEDDRSSDRFSSRDERDSFRSRDNANRRISRSRIENFRASSVSAGDLGLSLRRSTRGLIVDNVRSNPIARTLGLRTGDRIVSVEDYRVTSEDQFVRDLFDEDWRNDRITITVLRNGEEVPVYVRPAQLIERLIVMQDDSNPLDRFGIVLDDRYNDELVVRRVIPNSVAYRAGLRQGDVIVRFYGQRLSSPQQFVQVLNRVDVQQVPIVVERDRRLREFQVSLPAELRTTSQSRTTYRQQYDSRTSSPSYSSGGQWQGQATGQIQYGETYPQTYGSAGVITTEPAQPVYSGQFQPAQPVQPSNRADDRVERPGILPRLFGR